MPLDRLILIVLSALGAAALTVWIVAALMAAWVVPGWAMLALIPTALVVYVIARLLIERARDGEEDRRYDRIER